MSRPIITRAVRNGVPGEYSTVDLGYRIETVFFPDDNSPSEVVGVHAPLSVEEIHRSHIEIDRL